MLTKSSCGQDCLQFSPPVPPASARNQTVRDLVAVEELDCEAPHAVLRVGHEFAGIVALSEVNVKTFCLGNHSSRTAWVRGCQRIEDAGMASHARVVPAVPTIPMNDGSAQPLLGYGTYKVGGRPPSWPRHCHTIDLCHMLWHPAGHSI